VKQIVQGVGAAIVLLACLAAGWVFFGRRPALPAIVTPGMNAHEAVSHAVDARIGRILHDRPPAVRPSGARLVALTFDDGPFPVATPLLLDALAALDVRATFFLIGRDAQQFPALTRRIAAGGHEVANHTFSHPNLDGLSAAALVSELNEAAEVLYPLTRDAAVRSYMRPPHGRISEEGIRAAQGAGYNVVFWTDDPADERSSDPALIAERIVRHATQPDIVLLHAGHLATIEMLPAVVGRFRAAGYRFVTVRELLAAQPLPAVQHPLRQTI
jgi:peptidoglycan/xylan/chitin deacetylase (PgdA/CDA1 family)